MSGDKRQAVDGKIRELAVTAAGELCLCIGERA